MKPKKQKAKAKGPPPALRLHREGAGFYRSYNLRFSARRETSRRWVAADRMKPGQLAKCRTLRDCRGWFKMALTCDPPIEITQKEPPKLKLFF